MPDCRDTAEWVGDVRGLIEHHEGETPQFRKNLWEHTFETPSYISTFLPPERYYTDWFVPTTISGVKDRALSKSYIAVLPAEEKEKLQKDIDTVMQSRLKDWLDEKAGIFKYPSKTTVIVMKKQPLA